MVDMTDNERHLATARDSWLHCVWSGNVDGALIELAECDRLTRLVAAELLETAT